MSIDFREYGVKERLYLISSDTVLDREDMNKGVDLLRRVFGNYFYYTNPADSTDSTAKSIILETNSEDKVENLTGREVFMHTVLSCEQVQYAEANPARVQVIDRSINVPNLKIPFRLYADRDKKSVKGDFHWKQFLFGGEYGGEQLPPRLNSQKIFYDASMAIMYPVDYKIQNAYDYNSDELRRNTLTCNIYSDYYEYNSNVQNYQDWSSTLESELLIPNFYIIADYYYKYTSEEPDLADEDTVANAQLSNIQNKNETILYHFPVGYYFEELKRDQYFGQYFPKAENEKYKQTAMNSQQNIIFDQYYFDFLEETTSGLSSEEFFRERGVHDKLSNFYNVRIKFDRHKNQLGARALTEEELYPFGVSFMEMEYDIKNQTAALGGIGYQEQKARTLIENEGFSSKLLEILKDIDEGNIEDVPRKRLPFNYIISKEAYGQENGAPTSLKSVFVDRPDDPVGLMSMNFMDLLTYTYNNYSAALNENFIFAGPDTPQRVGTLKDDSFYRSLNSSMLIKVLDGCMDLLQQYMKRINPASDTPPTDEEIKHFTSQVMKYVYGPRIKQSETLAYKIEKIGGNVSNDDSEQNVIQKFWIFNATNAPPELSIVDSQVKYGQEYTYKITAYNLVMSHKYKYEDFRLTKQIGAADYLGSDDEIEYCLQFYNPETNIVSPQLFANANLTLAADDPRRSVLSGLNALAPNSVEISQYPQLLDFHLLIEPCLELIEVPYYQKTIKVMDNPCNSINVTPFHFIDNTNRVGFQINQESFIKRPYPELVTPQDLIKMVDYKNTKNLEAYNPVSLISQSPARYIEVYRIKHKPNSFMDFKDGLVATIDLRIKDQVYNFSNKIISDQIKSNTVYYYVFRFVNENGLHGPLSQIIQCELVNDGGYTYALFDTVDSSEFNPSQITNVSTSFKKLMQLDPNVSQLYFDDSSVNYNDFAQNQISNLIVGLATQKIWDKKFKIRLTSKKTSKKLDLNISYDLVERNFSKMELTPAPPTSYEEPELPTLESLEAEPIEVTYATGVGAVGAILESELRERIYGVGGDPVSGVYLPYTSIDAGESFETAPVGDSLTTGGDLDFGEVVYDDGSISYEPVRDGLVKSTDIVASFAAETALTTHGTGFPVSVYRMLAEPPGTYMSMVGDYVGIGGKSYISRLLSESPTERYTATGEVFYLSSATPMWDKTSRTFRPAFSDGPDGVGGFVRLLARFVYSKRNDSGMMVPLDRDLAFACCLYLLQLVPLVHSRKYPTLAFSATNEDWISNDAEGGPRFIKYAKQLNRIFYAPDSREKLADPLNYSKFDTHPMRPRDFSYSTLAELGLGVNEALFELDYYDRSSVLGFY